MKLLVQCLTDLDANGHSTAAAYVNAALCLVDPAYGALRPTGELQ